MWQWAFGGDGGWGVRMRRPVSFAPPDWSTPLMGRWGSGMTSALLRWEAEVGGQCGHGAGGLLAAVVNIGALAVICPEAHEDA